MYECLVAISRDPDVVVVRMKNRFDPELDSAASAGYRNLAINLKLVTEETQSLGIELHVCEVQLLLLKMAIIKARHQHNRIIENRKFFANYSRLTSLFHILNDTLLCPHDQDHTCLASYSRSNRVLV